jgi:hypothetical protein
MNSPQVARQNGEPDEDTVLDASSRKAALGRLFILELNAGRVHSMNPDGSDRKVIVSGIDELAAERDEVCC